MIHKNYYNPTLQTYLQLFQIGQLMISVSLVVTVILVYAENRKDTYKLIEIEFVKLKKRLDVNVPSLNVDKTKFLTFATSPYLLLNIGK